MMAPETRLAPELLFDGGHVAHIVQWQDWLTANRRRVLFDRARRNGFGRRVR